MYLCFNINFVKIVNCTFSITEKKNKNSETILIVSIEELIEEENIK